MLAAHLELHFDEAYYWYWSQNLQQSYYDHPPAVAWFIRAGTALFGNTEFGVRFFGQISVLVSTLFLFDAARHAFSLRSALIASFATQATLLLGAGSIVLTPDTPLLLYSTIVIWALVRFTLAPDGYWWLIAGLAGGGALLSKYSAGFLAVAVALWVIATPKMRHWLTRPWPWLALLTSAACFLPVLLWNAEHDWASFTKQGGRLWRWDALRPHLILEYLGGQIGIITPGLFVLLLVAVWFVAQRALRQRAPLDTLLALWFLVPAIFFLVVSPMIRVQANWLAPAWPAAFLALAALIERYGEWPRLRTSLFGALLTGGVLVVLVWLYALKPFGPHFKHDPLAHLNGQRAFADDIANLARRNGSTQIIALDYATASMLRFYMPSDMAVTHFTTKPRYTGFPITSVSLPAVVVTRSSSPLPAYMIERYQIDQHVAFFWRSYRDAPNKQYFISIATEVQQ
jgi:4-amino-4-deoxy-L-arabinose transferase-like glycosyltransferase